MGNRFQEERERDGDMGEEVCVCVLTEQQANRATHVCEATRDCTNNICMMCAGLRRQEVRAEVVHERLEL